MTVVFYVSVHGLGHISRCAEVVNAIRARRPDARVVLKTHAPSWFIESAIRREALTIIAGENVEHSPGVDSGHGVSSRGRIVRVNTGDLVTRGLRYEDLVAAADVVITKPGYGIVSECAANGAAILYARRGSFIEQDLLIREMPRVVRARAIAIDRLLEGRWREDIDAVLTQPPPTDRLAVDGADIAADAILRLYT